MSSCFKRANWHSGLTYRQQCDQCKTGVQYTDYNLDYRPWYPDGFVYCPKCKTPLRHNENYAINNGSAPQVVIHPQEVDNTPAKTDAPTNVQDTSTRASFCVGCGYKFTSDENFCPHCGKKRLENI